MHVLFNCESSHFIGNKLSISHNLFFVKSHILPSQTIENRRWKDVEQKNNFTIKQNIHPTTKNRLTL